jgi:integrase
MPRKKLSALSIPTLPPGNWPDQVVTGLILRVGTNRKTWSYRYRAGGRNPRVRLGHYPVMGLSAAREAARKTAERIDSGAVALAPAPHPRSASALTLGALIDRYEALRTKESARTKTLPSAMRTLRLCLKPWLGLPAAQFSKADLRAARDAIVERDAIIQANRLLAYLGPVMRWAAQEDLVPFNFVRDLRRAPERRRERVLTHKEIAAIWRACDRLNDGPASRSFARLVRFLLVTAQRRDEGASLRHGDILNGVWRQGDNKSSRQHTLWLPSLARALVGSGQARDLVFPGTNGKISGFSKMKRRLDAVAGVNDWRLHDLRRSAATGMQTAGVPNAIVQAVLNHAVPGVGGVYLKSELEQQKRDALATWDGVLARIVSARGVA